MEGFIYDKSFKILHMPYFNDAIRHDSLPLWFCGNHTTHGWASGWSSCFGITRFQNISCSKEQGGHSGDVAPVTEQGRRAYQLVQEMQPGRFVNTPVCATSQSRVWQVSLQLKSSPVEFPVGAHLSLAWTLSGVHLPTQAVPVCQVSKSLHFCPTPLGFPRDSCLMG